MNISLNVFRVRTRKKRNKENDIWYKNDKSDNVDRKIKER